MKKADKCKHFNGVQNGTCEAGVKYDDVKVTTAERITGRALPCVDEFNPGGIAKCACHQYPTPEEVAADAAAVRKMFEGVTTARAAIVARLGGPWKKGTVWAQGVIDCPVCSQPKALQFSRSGYNGHIHAVCKTAGCVSWME